MIFDLIFFPAQPAPGSFWWLTDCYGRIAKERVVSTHQQRQLRTGSSSRHRPIFDLLDCVVMENQAGEKRTAVYEVIDAIEA